MTRTLADWFFLRVALLATQPFHCLLPLEEGVGTPFELLSEGHQSHPQRLPQDSSPPRWATSDPLSWVLGFQYVNLRSTQTSKTIVGVGISAPFSTSKANRFWSFLLSPSTHCYHCLAILERLTALLTGSRHSLLASLIQLSLTPDSLPRPLRQSLAISTHDE